MDKAAQCPFCKRDLLTQIRLPERVYSDAPYGSRSFAEAGVHEIAHMNPHGAICVRDNEGNLLGVKPGEFEFVWLESMPPPALRWELENLL